MGQVVEHLQALAHDVVRALAFNVDHKADAAGVMLVSGIVETFFGRYGAQVVHQNARL